MEAKKSVEEANAAHAEEIEEKQMERLETSFRNRQEQTNQLLERLKEHVSCHHYCLVTLVAHLYNTASVPLILFTGYSRADGEKKQERVE